MFGYDEVPYELTPPYVPVETTKFTYGDAAPTVPMMQQAYGSLLSNVIGTPVADFQNNLNKMLMVGFLGAGALIVILIVGVGAIVVLSKK